MTPDQKFSGQSFQPELSDDQAREIYRVIAEGVVNARQVGRLLTSNLVLHEPPRYSGGGLGPFSTASEVTAALPHLSQVQEIDSGRTLYRLGDEFLSAEALALIATLSPDQDIQRQARAILEHIPNQ